MAASIYKQDLNLKATELRLGLPGSDEPDHESSSSFHLVKNNKRTSSQLDSSSRGGDEPDGGSAPAPKAQVVGWPPVRSYRKNITEQQKKAAAEQESGSRFYVKVSMDGAPYLRKIDLMIYSSYSDLLKALDNMFKCSIGVYSEREGYNGSDHAPIYEDKDGDWMLVGDVPWDMFINSCKRLRLMRASQVKGSRVD